MRFLKRHSRSCARAAARPELSSARGEPVPDKPSRTESVRSVANGDTRRGRGVLTSLRAVGGADDSSEGKAQYDRDARPAERDLAHDARNVHDLMIGAQWRDLRMRHESVQTVLTGADQASGAS